MEQNNRALIERVRYLIEMSRMSQGAFARRLGIDPSNLSKHLSGKLSMGDALINRVIVETGVSRQWLRDGIGTPFDKHLEPMAIDLRSDQMVEISPEDSRLPEGIVVYDIDVTAGCQELSRMFTQDRAIGMVNLPNISPGSVIVHVSGDSMDPTIKNGGYIAIRPFRDLKNIFWGQIYVVVMDDYRMVKIVRRHPEPSKVILHSVNPAYDDMDVDRADIRSLFMVESILNFEVRG